MDSQPLVSVILIFLNCEKFFQEAIESVFTQTYRNWELLLVDDGSTDGSSKIALGYAGQHPNKIRYLEHAGHQNRGMSASRNLGIKNSTGKYVALLDADDVWLVHKLEQQVAILESHPEAAMVFGPAHWWFGWTGIAADIQRDCVKAPAVEFNTIIRPPTLITLFLQREGIIPSPSGVLLQRQAIDRVGGFEESFKTMYEDVVFFAKICSNSPVFVASECWYRFRKHPDSCCAVAVKTGKYYPARLIFLNWLEEYLSRHKITERELWKVVKKGLWPYRHPLLYSLLSSIEDFAVHTKQVIKLVGRRALPALVRR